MGGGHGIPWGTPWALPGGGGGGGYSRDHKTLGSPNRGAPKFPEAFDARSYINHTPPPPRDPMGSHGIYIYIYMDLYMIFIGFL